MLYFGREVRPMKNKLELHLISNLRFTNRFIRSRDRTALPLFFALAVLEPLLRVGEMVFAPAVIWLIQKEVSAPLILAAAAGLTLFVLLCRVAYRRIGGLKIKKTKLLAKEFSLYLSEKIMDTDFDMLEGPAVRDKYQRAKNTLQDKTPDELVSAFIALGASALTVFSMASVIATLDWRLLLYIIVVEAAGTMLPAMIADRKVNAQKDDRAVTERRLNYVTKNARDFAAAKDIRLYNLRVLLGNLSRYYLARRKKQLDDQYGWYVMEDVALAFGSLLIQGGAYAFLIYKMVTSDLPGAQIVLFFSAMISFGSFLQGVSTNLDGVYKANLSVNDYRNFMAIKSVSVEAHGAPVPQTDRYEFAFERVSFTYPGSDTPVLKELSFTWRAGERLALVGVNGAGKTTLVKLICGLYRPTSGRILLNGQDIAFFGREDYYRIISAVFQDPRLLPVSVAVNVSMRQKEETDEAKLDRCLTLAGLKEKIDSLPEGADTLLVKEVNEDGTALSGGETQKLLFARALYKDAPILILDEPTAALDPIAEQELYEQYGAVTEGKTSLYISHRLSSTRFCDNILLLDGGVIAEAGAHAELLAKNGKYAEMFRMQSQYYQKEAKIHEMEERTANAAV